MGECGGAKEPGLQETTHSSPGRAAPARASLIPSTTTNTRVQVIPDRHPGRRSSLVQNADENVRAFVRAFRGRSLFVNPKIVKHLAFLFDGRVERGALFPVPAAPQRH